MDKQQLKSILVAVRAGVGRDEKLIAAVQAGAARAALRRASSPPLGVNPSGNTLPPIDMADAISVDSICVQ